MNSVDRVVKALIIGYEKRREGGKHYVYKIKITYASEKKNFVWRRYSQFDALRTTFDTPTFQAAGVNLPKLPPKKYFGRSNIRSVAVFRRPVLQQFLDGALAIDSDIAAQTLLFFLTPTTMDESTSNLEAIRTTEGYVSEEDSDDETAQLKVQPALLHGTACEAYVASIPGEVSVEKDEHVTIWPPLDTSYVMVSKDDNSRGMLPTSIVKLNQETDSDQAREKLETPAGPEKPKAMSVTEEIVQTEKDFHAHMVDVRDSFFKQLRTILTAPEAKCLFGNFAELVLLAEEMSKALDGAGPDASSVAAVLAESLPALEKPYGKYCSGIPAAQDLYSKKMEEKKFASFEQSFPNLNKPTLNNFMRPVQRIMKYPLLISELKKEASKSAAKAGAEIAGAANIDAALDIASKLALAANANMTAPQESLSASLISRPKSGTFEHRAKASVKINNKRARCKYQADTRDCKHFTIDNSSFCVIHTCENLNCSNRKTSRQVFCETCQNATAKRKKSVKKGTRSTTRQLYKPFNPDEEDDYAIHAPLKKLDEYISVDVPEQGPVPTSGPGASPLLRSSSERSATELASSPKSPRPSHPGFLAFKSSKPKMPSSAPPPPPPNENKPSLVTPVGDAPMSSPKSGFGRNDLQPVVAKSPELARKPPPNRAAPSAPKAEDKPPIITSTVKNIAEKFVVDSRPSSPDKPAPPSGKPNLSKPALPGGKPMVSPDRLGKPAIPGAKPHVPASHFAKPTISSAKPNVSADKLGQKA